MSRVLKNKRSASASKKENTIIKTKVSKTQPTASKIIYYREDENGLLSREREKVIGNTVYTVIARQNPNAKLTAFEIMKRLIENSADSVSNEPLTTKSLESCNSGGNK